MTSRKPSLAIRRAARTDLDALDGIEGRSFTGDRFARRNLARALTSGATMVVLAEADGAPAGYAMVLFRTGAGVARLYSVAVDPAFRGRGIGEALVAAAERTAAARGARFLRLEHRSSNKAAARLYQRAGFTLLETKAAYYDDGEDAIRLQKALRPEEAADGDEFD